MFDRPGIDTTTDVAWITRDQFVHYLEMAHALTDPTDWPTLRDELHRALAATFGLEPPRESAGPDRRSRANDAVPQLLDEIRHEHDPATDWDAFREALWHRSRRVIRPSG